VHEGLSFSDHPGNKRVLFCCRNKVNKTVIAVQNVNKRILNFTKNLPIRGTLAIIIVMTLLLILDPFQKHRFPRADRRAQFENGQVRGRDQMIDPPTLATAEKELRDRICAAK
jgi:hypothetical protein